MADQNVSSNTFTDEGRLSQAEYAIKNVSKAGTVMGLVCSNGVVLIGINTSRTSNNEKIYKLNNNSYCAVAGIFSDALRLVKYARLQSSNLFEEIDEDPQLSVLCDTIAVEKQRYTQYGGSRPFGVSFLYCGIENNQYALFSTDPSGTVNRWKAWTFGSDEEAINNTLKDNMNSEMIDTDEGVVFLLKSLKKVRECTLDIADKLEILIFNKENPRMLKTDEIKKILSDLECKQFSDQ